MEEKYNTILNLKNHIESSAPCPLGSCVIEHDELTVVLDRDNLDALTHFLREDVACLFSVLLDITAVDFPQRVERFEVVYHFLSLHNNQRIRLKVCLRDNDFMPTLTSTFPSAGWYEREVFDMYGILFKDHNDLRRILTDYGFQGHPLRKDFPLTGFVEVHYDEENERVAYKGVELEQAYRDFSFESPWEGVAQASKTFSQESVLDKKKS